MGYLQSSSQPMTRILDLEVWSGNELKERKVKLENGHLVDWQDWEQVLQGVHSEPNFWQAE